MTTTTLYRPVGSQELALIEASGWREFPPHPPERPAFSPVTDEAYARQMAQKVCHKLDELGFVTRFAVLDEFLSRYERKAAGAREREEYSIPAEDLSAFNAAIDGRIEIIGAYGVDGDRSDILVNF
jgi:hypothetical protein